MIDFKSLRARAGLTQAQMADTLGIKQSAYSKLESGGWNASPDTEAKYIEYIKGKFPNIDVNEFKDPTKVSVSNNRSRLRDVKIATLDSRAYEIISSQTKQIADLTETINRQNELIMSLIKSKLK